MWVAYVDNVMFIWAIGIKTQEFISEMFLQHQHSSVVWMLHSVPEGGESVYCRLCIRTLFCLAFSVPLWPLFSRSTCVKPVQTKHIKVRSTHQKLGVVPKPQWSGLTGQGCVPVRGAVGCVSQMSLCPVGSGSVSHLHLWAAGQAESVGLLWG